jgi:site-specific recombinase XerD
MIEQFLVWLAATEHRPLTAETRRAYQRQVEAFARWLEAALGLPCTAETVTPYRMEAYLAYLQHDLKRAPATQMKAIAALKALSRWLVETNQRSDAAARHLHAQPEQQTPPKALSATIVRRVLDAAHHTGALRDAIIVEVLAKSGLRASEVAGIQVEHLERGARTMWIRVVGKGRKLRRVPLPKSVGQLIEDYLALRMEREGQRPVAGPLLVGQRGGITRSTINSVVASVAAHAKLTPAQRALVTPHAFRHTVATNLVRQRDLVTVADLLGHTNVNTTRRYAKASATELEEAVELLRYTE